MWDTRHIVSFIADNFGEDIVGVGYESSETIYS